ncbi:MAG: hypothetical protein ACK4M3_07395, partial [Pyrobaculum sp.]
MTDEELYHLTAVSFYIDNTHENQEEMKYLPCIFYFNKQTLELIKNRLFSLLISGNESQRKSLIRFFKA